VASLLIALRQALETTQRSESLCVYQQELDLTDEKSSAAK
jgi:hypothetical protein